MDSSTDDGDLIAAEIERLRLENDAARMIGSLISAHIEMTHERNLLSTENTLLKNEIERLRKRRWWHLSPIFRYRSRISG